MNDYRLMVPGPTNVPPEVLEEISKPMIYHREKEFENITIETIQLLKQLFETRKGEVLIVPSSGRGGMEAALVNLFTAGDQVMVISNGYFGELFSNIAKAMGLSVVDYKQDWDKFINYEAIEQILIDNKEIRAIICTHCETSNAIENDLNFIGNLANKYNKLFIVDAVSSCGCTSIGFDNNHIDVAITASQKGLMNPAGLSIVALSEKALHELERSRLSKFYFDFKPMIEFIKKGQTPVSTPVPLVRGLRIALNMMQKETFESVYLRHRYNAEYIREKATKLGYELYPQIVQNRRANSLSAFSIKGDISSENLVKHIKSKYNTLFAKGLGKNFAMSMRIGHMGWFNEEDADHVINVLKSAQIDLNL